PAQPCARRGQGPSPGPLSEQQLVGHLAVRAASADKGRDAPLGRRQSFLARPPADPSELVARSLDPGRRSEILELGERGADRVTGSPLLPCAPEDHAQREQRASASEDIADLVVPRDRELQQRGRFVYSPP